MVIVTGSGRFANGCALVWKLRRRGRASNSIGTAGPQAQPGRSGQPFFAQAKTGVVAHYFVISHHVSPFNSEERTGGLILPASLRATLEEAAPLQEAVPD